MVTSRRRMFNKIILIGCVLLSLSCAGQGGAPQAQQGGGAQPTATALVVDSLQVAAGEERVLEVDSLQSKGPITIEGKLTLRRGANSTVDTITITAESGDMNIRGNVVVEGMVPRPTTTSSSKTTFFEKVASLLFNTATAQVVATDISNITSIDDGLNVRLVAEGGRIVLQSNGIIATPSCSEKAISITVNTFQAPRIPEGCHGGDIFFQAGMNDISFEDTKEASFIFSLGNGSPGIDVVLDDSSLSDQAPQTFTLAAGKGGRSGRLVFEGKGTLRFHRPPSEIQIAVVGGQGGRGGGVQAEFISPHQFVGLQSLELFSGDGGDGVILGGKGGDVTSRMGSDSSGQRRRSFMARKQPTPSTVVKTGNGGNLFAFESFGAVSVGFPFTGTSGSATLPQLKAGDAGSIIKIEGFSGQNGSFDSTASADELNGAHGGRVEVYFGNGGDVSPGLYHKEGISGGNGGMIERDPYRNSTTPVIFGGDGGNGGPNCRDPSGPGGRGGNAGEVIVTGGNGGYPGGSGGFIYRNVISLGKPGMGGVGEPPGNGGEKANFTFVPGKKAQLVADFRTGADGELRGDAPAPLAGVAGSRCSTCLQLQQTAENGFWMTMEKTTNALSCGEETSRISFNDSRNQTRTDILKTRSPSRSFDSVITWNKVGTRCQRTQKVGGTNVTNSATTTEVFDENDRRSGDCIVLAEPLAAGREFYCERRFTNSCGTATSFRRVLTGRDGLVCNDASDQDMENACREEILRRQQEEAEARRQRGGGG